MKRKPTAARCAACHQRFLPDPRIGKRQRYCRNPECRRASKAASQEKWLKKPENSAYFKGAGNALRVRVWRANNPKKTSRRKPERRLTGASLAAALRACGVQDLNHRQLALLLGVVSLLARTRVQEEIARCIRRLMFAGYAVLREDEPTATQQRTPAPDDGGP